LLEKLRERIDKDIEHNKGLEATRRAGRLFLHYYYCPKCLSVMMFFKNNSYIMREFYRLKKRGKRPLCSECKVEMRPVDEHFKAEYERVMWAFYDKVKSVLERAWPIIDSWGISGYIADAGLVRVYFDEYPTSIELIRDGKRASAYLYVRYLDEEQLEKLLRLINILREEGVKGEVQVDGRSDHCKVPEEKMRAQGFARTYEVKKLTRSLSRNDWLLEL
jgi:hypothetical protein